MITKFIAKFKILCTCPPMIKQIARYKKLFAKNKLQVTCPKILQTLTEQELIKLVPDFDAWIIGDDPATAQVLEAGKKGKLRVAVKWGVGIDNVDLESINKLSIKFQYTPAMFGHEVADVTIGYLCCLARELHTIDQGVRMGRWLKPTGISLRDKKICLLGFGDIGQQVARRLLAFDMNIFITDPMYSRSGELVKNNLTGAVIDSNYWKINFCVLSEAMKDAHFVIITCSLNTATYHLINKSNLLTCIRGVRVINIARGPIIFEQDLIDLLDSGHIGAVALDVYEKEPISPTSRLLKHKSSIFGTHNSSNTIEAVDRVSHKTIKLVTELLNT